MLVEFSEARVDTHNGTWLCLRISPECLKEAMRIVYEAKGRYDAEVKKHREKRSLDANAYCWALLSEMSDALQIPKNELYRQKVAEFGPYKDFTLTEDEARTFRHAWELLGVGWPTEQVDYEEDGDRVIVRAYYGSSTYNTRQMSRLIDAIVEDCRALGIETMTEEKLSLLKDGWNGNTP